MAAKIEEIKDNEVVAAIINTRETNTDKTLETDTTTKVHTRMSATKENKFTITQEKPIPSTIGAESEFEVGITMKDVTNTVNKRIATGAQTLSKTSSKEEK